MCQGVHFGLFAKTSSQVATIFECKSRLEAADVLPQELQTCPARHVAGHRDGNFLYLVAPRLSRTSQLHWCRQVAEN